MLATYLPILALYMLLDFMIKGSGGLARELGYSSARRAGEGVRIAKG